MNLVPRQIAYIFSVAAIFYIYLISPVHAEKKEMTCVTTDRGERVCGRKDAPSNSTSQNSNTAQIGSIVMSIDRCVRYQGNGGSKLLGCVFTLSSKHSTETTGFLWVSGASALDSEGSVYRGSYGQLGGYSGGNLPITLVPGAKYRGAIAFSNISEEIKSLQLVTIQFMQRDFTFRNIPVIDQN